MTAARRDRDDEQAVLKLAAEGDEDAFRELVEPYRAELRAHCYRMLGSLHDAEDALQDALLRAWRGLAGFEGRGSVRSWLYSIATNAAVDITRHRSRRELPVSFGPAAGPGGLEEPVAEPVWLEPYPDRGLAGDAGSSPEARYEQRESVELAFLVIDVLTLAGEKISAVTAFRAAQVGGLPQGGGQETGEQFFARFGLPAGLT